MSRTTVADVLLDGLARAGTARLFAAPGAAAALGLVEAARRRGLAIVEAGGDTAAAIMAAVTAELTGAPGGALLRAAPLAGAIDGVAHAARDRAPLVVITAAHADAGLLAPVAKASLAPDAASAAHWIAHAALLAMGDPRGAVHLALDPAVAAQAALPLATSCRPGPLPPPAATALDAAAAALRASARPLLVAGLQCGGDESKWVRAFAEALPAPLVATPRGKGTLADPHPLALGLLGQAPALLERADLIVTLGLDPAEAPPRSWPASTPVLRLGRVAPAAGPPAAVEVVGDIALIIEELAPRLRERDRADWDVAELDRFKRAVVAPPATPAAGLALHRAVAIAREATPAGTIATADVPVAAFWPAVAPREFLVPHGLATPGFALPAAIAAQLVHPDRTVVAFAGAAGLASMTAELATAARLAVPSVVVAVHDAGSAGEAGDLARAAGLAVFSAASDAEFSRAFADAFATRGPAMVVAHVVR